MLFDIIWALLLALARFLALDGMWCEAERVTSARYAIQPQSFVAMEPLHDAAIAGENLIVVSGSDRDRHLVRSTPRGGDETLASLSMKGSLAGEVLAAGGKQWWYGTSGERNGVMTTTFVSDAGSGNITTSAVPVAGRGPYVFVPLKGDQPRALQFSRSEDKGMLVVEVDGGGPVRSWHLPLTRELIGRVSAERLPDGRIALISVDRDASQLKLSLLDKDEQIETTVLREEAPFQLSTASDPAGHVAIVIAAVAPGGQQVEGALVDPDHPSLAVWHQLSGNARLAAWPAPELKVIATTDGFVAAWINRAVGQRLRLQARELTIGHVGASVVDIGEPFETRGAFGVFFAMQRDRDDLSFFWDDGRRIVMRPMPSSISGLDLVARLAMIFCRDQPKR